MTNNGSCILRQRWLNNVFPTPSVGRWGGIQLLLLMRLGGGAMVQSFKSYCRLRFPPSSVGSTRNLSAMPRRNASGSSRRFFQVRTLTRYSIENPLSWGQGYGLCTSSLSFFPTLQTYSCLLWSPRRLGASPPVGCVRNMPRGFHDPRMNGMVTEAQPSSPAWLP